MQIKERRRKIMPAVYNPARLEEEPMPLLVLAENSQKVDDQLIPTDQNDPLVLSGDTSKHTANENDSNQARDSSTASDKENVPDVNDAANENVLNIGDEVDQNVSSATSNTSATQFAPNEKTSASFLPSTHMVPNLNFAFATTSTPKRSFPLESRMQPPKVSAEMLASAINTVQVELKPELPPMDEEDHQAVEDIFNSSYEMVNVSDDDILIHKDEYVPRPMSNSVKLQVKVNDILSGNIPFGTDVSILINIFICNCVKA